MRWKKTHTLNPERVRMHFSRFFHSNILFNFQSAHTISAQFVFFVVDVVHVFFSLHFSLCFVLVYISVSSFWNSFCRFSLRLRWICVLKLEAHKCLSHRFCWPFLVCLFHFSSHVRFYPCTISKRYWWYFLRRFSITMLPCAKNGASFMFISEAKLSLDYFGAFWL